MWVAVLAGVLIGIQATGMLIKKSHEPQNEIGFITSIMSRVGQRFLDLPSCRNGETAYFSTLSQFITMLNIRNQYELALISSDSRRCR
jgi:hypothetical protein